MADLVWNANAVRDLTLIAAFISESSPNRAIGFILRIVEATERLRRFPSMGRVVPEFADPERRELIFQNYRVIYRHRAATVAIVAVVHAAMDLEARSASADWFLT